jgi:hypothetical protein
MARDRREVLSALGTASVFTFAGCAGDDGRADTETDDHRNTNSPTEQETATDQQATPALQQQMKLAASDGDEADNFGGAVAIAGNGSTALIGAGQDEDPNGAGAGSAYVFE